MKHTDKYIRFMEDVRYRDFHFPDYREGDMVLRDEDLEALINSYPEYMVRYLEIYLQEKAEEEINAFVSDALKGSEVNDYSHYYEYYSISEEYEKAVEYVKDHNHPQGLEELIERTGAVAVRADMDVAMTRGQRCVRDILDELSEQYEVSPLSNTEVSELDTATLYALVFNAHARDIYAWKVETEKSKKAYFVLSEFIVDTSAGSYKVTNAFVKSDTWGGELSYNTTDKQYLEVTEMAELRTA